MKRIIALVLASAAAFAADAPQTIIPRPEIKSKVSRMWFNPISGCDILNYHLFDYTNRHPERVKYTGDDDVVTVDGFIEYLVSKSPFPVREDDGMTAALIFFDGRIFTPWGQEIVFLVDRKKDGYLTAFGERASVNEYADPWKKEGFKYSKAVGITLKSRPDFVDPGGRLLIPLNDNEFNRLKDMVLRSK